MIEGVVTTQLRFTHIGLSGVLAAKTALEAAAKYLAERVRENASASCHDVTDFMKWIPEVKARWNPYAKKWHGNPPLGFPHPEKRWLVHRWTGSLAESVYTKVEVLGSASVGRIVVGLDEDVAPHARYIIYGTVTRGGGGMVPRDFLKGTLEENRTVLHGQFREKFASETEYLFRIVPALYFLSRTSKYIGKFINVAPFTNTMFRLARRARDIEVASLHPVGLSSRLYNRVLGGKIASRFVIRRAGYATASVNAFIARSFTSKVFFAPLPRMIRSAPKIKIL